MRAFRRPSKPCSAHHCCARRACATRSAMSAAVWMGNCPTCSPVAGLRTSNIVWLLGWTSVAIVVTGGSFLWTGHRIEHVLVPVHGADTGTVSVGNSAVTPLGRCDPRLCRTDSSTVITDALQQAERCESPAVIDRWWSTVPGVGL